MDEAKPRVLICRLSAVGDCVLTAPVACALRERFPEAFIAWATQPGPASLIRRHEAVDEVIAVPRDWLKRPSEIWRLRRMLRAREFDVAIDVQSLTKSAALAWLSGAKRRIGFAAPQGREAALWLNNERVSATSDHVVDRYRELLGPLGGAPPTVRFGLRDDARAAKQIETFLAQQRLPPHGYAVLNPGAGWDSKLWPAERYADVGRHLSRTHQLRSVVVWAGEREHAWARQIVGASAESSVLAPPTDLPELASLLRRAALFVGSDTGPLHLAAAVGTRCVGVYGPTRPEESGPYGLGHVVAQEYYQEGTHRERVRGGNEALQALAAGKVCHVCERALSSPKSSAA
jgi:lipopolysaccharide heptosyltransferase I